MSSEGCLMSGLHVGDLVMAAPMQEGGWYMSKYLVSVGRERELRLYRVVDVGGRLPLGVTIEHVSGGPRYSVGGDTLIPVSVLILSNGERYEGNVPVKDDGLPSVTLAQCGHCKIVWNDDLSTQLTPPPSGRCPNEYNHVHPETHGAIWIEWDDESGESGSARWGTATDAQIEAVTKAVTAIMAREPDTVT